MRAIDIVPDSRVLVNGNKFYTKFMPPQYTEIAMKELNCMTWYARKRKLRSSVPPTLYY